jgi:hypothetical protein
MGRGTGVKDPFTIVLGVARGNGVAEDYGEHLYYPAQTLLNWAPYIVDFALINADKRLDEFSGLRVGAYYTTYDTLIPAIADSPDYIRPLIERCDKAVGGLKKSGKNTEELKTFIRGACRALILQGFLDEKNYDELIRPTKSLIKLSITHMEKSAAQTYIPIDKQEDEIIKENLLRLYDKSPFGWLPRSDFNYSEF